MTFSDFFGLDASYEKRRYLQAMAAMTVAAFFWAVIEHLGGLVPRGYSPVQTVWSRYLVHMLLMLILFAPRKRSALVRTRCLGLQVLRALLMVGMPACFIWGAAFFPVRVVWLAFWSSIVMLLALKWLLSREQTARYQWFAAGGGWLGIWAMSGAAFPPVSWQYLLPIGMGLCFALYVIMTSRMHGESTQTKLFHTAWWVFLSMSLVAPFQWKMPSFKVLVVYACIGLSGYLCLFFLDKSIEMAPVSVTVPMIFTVPLWSGIQEIIITGRPLEGMAAAGAVIIAGTSALLILAVWSGRVRLSATD